MYWGAHLFVRENIMSYITRTGIVTACYSSRLHCSGRIYRITMLRFFISLGFVYIVFSIQICCSSQEFICFFEPRMGRKPCSSGLRLGLNRGAWTPTEDLILKKYVQIHGEGDWSFLPLKAGLLRCGRSCRLRWMNYLRSSVKHDDISSDEEELILRLHKLLGNRWSLIAARIPGRTDNQIKNVWYSHLSKKAAKTVTQHCKVLKPVPFRYMLASPNKNTVGFNAEMIHMNDCANNFLFQHTNYKGKQTGGCLQVEEFVSKLPDWPFPQHVHYMAKGVTLTEMHISAVNPNDIHNTIDQGFWSPS